ncbi:site-2 protease family protein [Oscillospiraceae bacterium PP1C4]
MEFRLGGTYFSISFGFFAVLGLYMLFDREGAGLPAICAVALHEGGHILAMYLVGAQIVSMRFYPFGVRLEKRGILTYGKETAVYLGGVAANALCLLIAVPLYGWNQFAVVNAALILFNLLPVGRLDGGQLLRLLLCRMNSLSRAEALQKWIGFVVLTPLFAISFVLLPQGNYTLLFTAVYLAVTLLRG